jgi:hypothetical protein
MAVSHATRSSGGKGKAWDHEVPPLARGSRSSSGDGAVRDPDQIKVCRSFLAHCRHDHGQSLALRGRRFWNRRGAPADGAYGTARVVVLSQ